MSSRLLAKVALHLHSGVVLTDMRARAVWANRAFERLSGCAEHEWLGAQPLELLRGPGTDAQALSRCLQASSSGQAHEQSGLLLYAHDRRPFYCDLDVQPLRDEETGGATTHQLWVLADVTARQHAERAAAAQTQRLTLALDAARLGVWDVVEPEWGVLADAAARAQLGLPERAEAGTVPWQALPSGLQAWRPAVERVFRFGGPLDFEAWVETAAARRCLHFSGQRVLDAASHPRVLGVVVDQTRSREAQSRDEAQSLQAMLELERRDVLGRLRREMRMPLNSLLGFAQLVRADAHRGLFDGVVQRVGHIESAGAQLLDMLDELLAAAAGPDSGGEGRATLQPVVLRDALARHLPREVAFGGMAALGEDHAVWADPTLLRRALSLAGGLGQAAGAAGSGPGLELHLDMPPRMHTLIFSYPAANGLAPAALRSLRTELIGRLLSDMGASGESTETSEGLRLVMQLRSARGLHDADSAANREPPMDGWAERTDLTGIVLYVEDDPGNVAIVEDMLLSRPRVRLLVASDAQAAQELLSRPPVPNMLMLDLMLPGQSGLELLSAVRREPKTCTLPCIVITAVDDAHLHPLLRNDPATAYMAKPLRLDQLLSWVDQHLQGVDRPGAGE